MIIPGFSNYSITKDGVVTNVHSGAVSKHTVTSTSGGFYRYTVVSIVDDSGKRRQHNVLKLLAITYLEKPQGPCTVRAKDGNNLNISLDNAVWVPYSESARRAWELGKMTDRQPRKSCVTEESINLLYDTMLLYGVPVTMSGLSRELDLPYSTVRYSMYALMKRGKARKLEEGFELIR